MKHLWKWVACSILVVAATALAAAQEPLGDVARQERAKPKPHGEKVITNDDIRSAGPDVVAPEPSPTDSAEKAGKDEKADEKSDLTTKEGPLPANEEIKRTEMWKSKIAAQEAKVQSLDQQVQQIDRDYRLRMSAYYADLGLRLRDEAHWATEEKKYHEDIAKKQKERDAERDKLEDMKDAARRAGVHGLD
ncbi:MAG: hypothetical protein ROO76_21175 [Terriglobia bacterium]|jgi:hypothetical protein|nr:hypothetical protein [Terriglobia bacterium]